MVFRGDRVRIGEWVIGAAALVLLVSEFALKWYGLKGVLVVHFGAAAFSVNAWNSLAAIRWLILLVALAGLAAWWTQGACRSPALPIAITVMLLPVALLTSILLVNRVLISLPSAAHDGSIRPGAVVGLIAAIALTVGCYVSLRMDGIRPEDGPGEIETIRLADDPA